MTYSSDRGSAVPKRALRRLARENQPADRALYKQTRHTGDHPPP